MEEQPAPPRPLRARWLGRIAYREAWAMQQALAAARADGTLQDDQLLLLEHDPVLTLGRHAGAAHVRALPEQLAARGIEVLRVERGGEVTYHGPGQLVAYPIVQLGAPGSGTRGTAAALGVRGFVDALERAMADTCAAFDVAAGSRRGHPGCWIDADGPLPRKIGALGIRIARGVSYHGIALNVTTRLSDFDLIDPCGMPGLRSTSLARERARSRMRAADRDPEPTTASVGEAAAAFAPALAARLGLALTGTLPPAADPAVERRALEALTAHLGAPAAAARDTGASGLTGAPPPEAALAGGAR
jgi:lipoyl(octanoyl) transferase